MYGQRMKQRCKKIKWNKSMGKNKFLPILCFMISRFGQKLDIMFGFQNFI